MTQDGNHVVNKILAWRYMPQSGMIQYKCTWVGFQNCSWSWEPAIILYKSMPKRVIAYAKANQHKKNGHHLSAFLSSIKAHKNIGQ